MTQLKAFRNFQMPEDVIVPKKLSGTTIQHVFALSAKTWKVCSVILLDSPVSQLEYQTHVCYQTNTSVKKRKIGSPKRLGNNSSRRQQNWLEVHPTQQNFSGRTESTLFTTNLFGF